MSLQKSNAQTSLLRRLLIPMILMGLLAIGMIGFFLRGGMNELSLGIVMGLGLLISSWLFLLYDRILNPLKKIRSAISCLDYATLVETFSKAPQDEIAEIALALNESMGVLTKREETARIVQQKSNRALVELEQQKFALDQHCIVSITDTEGVILYF